MDIAGVAGDLWGAWTGDNIFLFARLLRQSEVWIIFAPIFIALVAFAVLLLRVPFIDRNLERWTMIVLYLLMTAIIFAEVLRRSAASLGWTDASAWAGSATVPAWIFLVLTWIGAAYSIKRRTQLNFNEVRSLMPRGAQFAMLGLDWLLWTGFAYIVFVVSVQRTVGSAANFQIIGGTDGMMQWWFYAAIPACWVLLAARAWLVFADDRRARRDGLPLINQASITETE